MENLKSLQPRKTLFSAGFYLYFIFKIRIIKAKINDRTLAKISGNELIKIPYINHKKIPTVNMEIKPIETSLVDLVFQAFTT